MEISPPSVADTPGSLDELTRKIASQTRVALDCEADSLHHYGEKLCLLQITLEEGGDHLVDPLAAGIDLRELLSALSGRELLFHGGDYDLRLLGLGWGFRASELFDTMIAAQYLGEAALGLSALVEREFGAVLDKSMQKADWSIRPLTPRMALYAAADTHFLPELVERMKERLAALGRLEWHRQACERLARAVPEPRLADPESDWRVKGSHDLSPRQLAVLREVWGFRESEARRRDVPPFKVASAELLVRTAKRALDAPGEDLFAGWKGSLPGGLRRGLRAAADVALALPEAEWPSRAPRGAFVKMPKEVEERLARLRQKRDARANELRIDPSILAPRAALEALARENVDQSSGADEILKTARLLPWQAGVLAAP